MNYYKLSMESDGEFDGKLIRNTPVIVIDFSDDRISRSKKRKSRKNALEKSKSVQNVSSEKSTFIFNHKAVLSIDL